MWNKETPYPEKPAAVCLFYRLSPFRCIPATHSDPGQKVAGFSSEWLAAFARNRWPASVGMTGRNRVNPKKSREVGARKLRALVRVKNLRLRDLKRLPNRVQTEALVQRR